MGFEHSAGGSLISFQIERNEGAGKDVQTQ
jgi:hypothetical protein